MKLRIFRLFICFLLVCCLLVRISPIQTKAVGAGILYNIAANTGVNLALRAIGVGPGNSPEVFNNLVTTIGEAVSSATAPLSQLLITGFSGNFRSFLSTDFLSWILNWLFDSGTISSNVLTNLSTSVTFLFNGASLTYTFTQPVSGYSYATTKGTYGVVFFGSSPFDAYHPDGYKAGFSNTTLYPGTTEKVYYYGFRTNTLSDLPFLGTCAPATYIGPELLNVVEELVPGYVGPSIDVSLDDVGESLDAAPYTDWVGQSVSNDDQAFVPVSVPSLDSSTISAQTQTQAQAGTIPDAVVDEIIAGEDVVPDTGTIADVITSIRALGADMVAAIQAVPAAIADVFMPSQTIEAYSLDLKSLFPFCIPFDIYAMLSALAAEPVAPKFDFELDFGPVGVIPISADFSEWDNVAQLLRTCEAALFAVGLAVKTKDLIGW